MGYKLTRKLSFGMRFPSSIVRRNSAETKKLRCRAANIIFLTDARTRRSLKDMFVPVSAREVASFGKVRDGRMQTREGEGLVMRRLLHLTYLLDLELDFSFLLYFL